MTKKSKQTEQPTAEVFSLERFKRKKVGPDFDKLEPSKDGLDGLKPSKPKQKKAAKPKRAPSAEPFFMLPFDRFLATYAKHRLGPSAWYLAMMLERLHFKDFHHKNPVHLTNEKLIELGMVMPRNTKARSLRDLQAAGLVSFTQTGNEAFQVTLTWHRAL
jgi:hypothetical protein